MTNRTGIKYPGTTTRISKVHINNMYIKYTFVHIAILLIRQVFGVVPLPVTIPFAVEVLSFRLRYSFGLLHRSGNSIAIVLEVPFLSLALLLETSGFVNHEHLMHFLISTFVDFSIAKSSGIAFIIPCILYFITKF